MKTTREIINQTPKFNINDAKEKLDYHFNTKWFSEEELIQKYTIDKAVLKEAINKHIVYCCYCGCTFGKDKLLKELGLDEEEE